MNLLESLTGGDSQNVVSELARQLGVGESEARSAASELIPALARGLQNNSASDGGLGSLIGALQNGNHGRFLDNIGSLGQQATVDEGNSILGHIFGNKDVSRNVANHGAQRAGLSSALMKKALPILATLVMGSLSKRLMGGGNARNNNSNIFQPNAAPSQNRGILSTFLDADKDGSILDDILGMAVKAAIR